MESHPHSRCRMAASSTHRTWLIAAIVVLAGGCQRPSPPAEPTEPAVAETPTPPAPVSEPAPATPPGPATPPASAPATPTAPNRPATPLANLTVPVVYLEPADLIAPAKDRTHALLLRELARQGFLVAARDGLGLSTRDATIGEDPPDDLPADNRLALTDLLWINQPSAVQVGRGPAQTRAALWSETLPQVKQEPADLLNMTVAAEQHSRDGFLAALRRIGFTGQPNRPGSAAVPDDVEVALADPCELAQCVAVRKLHARVRAEGESPALLGALARGYANLGLLTERLWGSACKAFQARGLLYAQRLVAAEPSSPWGLWHRAYAAALAGAHAWALSDLSAAAALPAPPNGPPGWVGLIDALVRFDTARLGQPQADAKLAPWAAVFRYLTVEGPDSVQLSVALGTAALKAAPDCARVRDGMAEIGGIAHRRRATADSLRAFGESLHRRLSALPDLPAEPAKLLKDKGTEPAVVAALVAAGKPRDAGELTWAVPGRLAEEARFAQLLTRLEFLRDVAQQPAVEELKAWRPAVAGHPLVAYLETYARPLKKDEHVRWNDQVVTSLRLRDFRPRHEPLYRALVRVGKAQRTWAWEMITTTADQTYGDQYALYRLHEPTEDTMRSASNLARVSHHAPVARAAYVDHRWPDAEPLVAGWEAETQSPILFSALGRRYASRKQWAAAERCLRKAIDRSADSPAYEALADVYSAQGKPNESVSTLEALLKRPDVDADLARIGLLLARRLLTAGDAARALPFAEAAAEAETEKSVDVAIECAERLGDWAKAEGWARRISERHPDRVDLWFLWCHRTGRGDLATATALVDQWQSRPNTEPEARDYLIAAARHLLGDSPGSGAAMLESAARMDKSARARLLAGVMYDAAGRPDDRDRAWAVIPDKDAMAQLVKLFQEALTDPAAEGRLDDGQADRLVARLPTERVWLPLYAIGRFHLNRGEIAKAQTYLEQVAKNRDEHFMAALAAHDLRALDKKDRPKEKEGK
jgi:tetratricopeptide (TPR) repeat protein